jgi:hypothetical protein
MTTIKQAIHWMIVKKHLPESCRIRQSSTRSMATDIHCWRQVEALAILKRCCDMPALGWLGDVLTALACTGMRSRTTSADYVHLPRHGHQLGLVNYQRLDDVIRTVALGVGFVELEAFFAGLREGGFAGYVAYEMCSPLRGGGSEENLDRVARTALAVNRRLTA